MYRTVSTEFKISYTYQLTRIDIEFSMDSIVCFTIQQTRGGGHCLGVVRFLQSNTLDMTTTTVFKISQKQTGI